jgi:hypothetical protein
LHIHVGKTNKIKKYNLKITRDLIIIHEEDFKAKVKNKKKPIKQEICVPPLVNKIGHLFTCDFKCEVHMAYMYKTLSR